MLIVYLLVSITIFENVTVFAPSGVAVHCKAFGEPLPGIIWMREIFNGSSTVLNDSTDNINITEIVDGLKKTTVLTIHPNNVTDTATYSCRVQNQLHSLTSKRAQINVFGMYCML